MLFCANLLQQTHPKVKVKILFPVLKLDINTAELIVHVLVFNVLNQVTTIQFSTVPCTNSSSNVLEERFCFQY